MSDPDARPDLRGKVAVVTGAASGIGLAYARKLQRGGMKLVLADVEAEQLDAAVAELGGDARDVIGVRTDVSRQEDLEALAARTMEHFGSVYAICNNAGVNAYGHSVWEAPLSTYEWVLRVNLWGMIHGVRAFVPLLVSAGEGHVVNTASDAGLRAGTPYIGAYSASKHAIIALSESLATELRDQGSAVRVTVVCPAKTRTRIRTSSRLWPEHLGPSGALGTHDADRRQDTTLADGDDPAVLADGLWRALHHGNFLVLPSVARGLGMLAGRFGQLAAATDSAPAPGEDGRGDGHNG